MEVIVMILEKLGMALLGTFFATLANSAKNAGIDASALDYLAQSVQSAEINPVLTTADAKFHFVYSDFMTYLKGREISITGSMLESLINLAVHNLHNSASKS